MNETDKIKYIQSQANIEIDHVRSWPTKVMAFYVAINFGIISAMITLQKIKPPVSLPWYIKAVITMILLYLTFYIILTLIKLNETYNTYRKLQINLQKKHFNDIKEEYTLPKFWFEVIKDSNSREYSGWLLYVRFVVLITILVLMGIWLI